MSAPPVEKASHEPGWDHAVVVGAGIAGLLAARVLSDSFHRVTIVERDPIDEDTDYRSGVPQARHPHALLAKGAGIVEELFPGLRAEFAEQGAPIFDLGESFHVLFPSGWAPREAIGLPLQTFTRATLEKGIRSRVMAREKISIRSGIRVVSLSWDPTEGRVTGVCVRTETAGSSQHDEGIETIDADLVVDASGGTSKLATTFLQEAGFLTPEQSIVEGDLSYTSRLYRIPPGTKADWKMTGEMTYAPDVRRGGGITTVEGGQWQITVIGAGGEPTPTSEDGFLEYAQSLRNPHIAASIAAADPVAPLYRSVKLNNRWTRFDRMRRWPERLVCIGDVVSALNPVYAQGMTIAAIEATILRSVLDRHRRNAQLDGLARRFQRSAARAVRQPWTMATSSDLAWSPKNTPLPARLAHWYFDQLIELIPSDPDLYRRFFLAAQMIKGPEVLMHPRILGQVAVTSLRKRTGSRQAPAVGAVTPAAPESPGGPTIA